MAGRAFLAGYPRTDAITCGNLFGNHFSCLPFRIFVSIWWLFKLRAKLWRHGAIGKTDILLFLSLKILCQSFGLTEDLTQLIWGYSMDNFMNKWFLGGIFWLKKTCFSVGHVLGLSFSSANPLVRPINHFIVRIQERNGTSIQNTQWRFCISKNVCIIWDNIYRIEVVQ